MRSPLPRQAVTGTCDGSGNATITNQITAPASFWALAYVPISVSAGAPTWTVQLGSKATAAPLIFGVGQQAILGPFLLLPNERATLVVTGATAGATITGQVLGWQSDSPEELMGLTPLTSAININVATSNIGQIGGAAFALGKQGAINALPVVVANDGSNPTYSYAATGVTTGALGIGATAVIASWWSPKGAPSNIGPARLKGLWVFPTAITAATFATFQLTHFQTGAGTVPLGTAITPNPMNTLNVSPAADAPLSCVVNNTQAGVIEDVGSPLILKSVGYGIIAGSTSDLFRDGLRLWPPAEFDFGAYESPFIPQGALATFGWNLKVTSSAAATLTFSIWAILTSTAPSPWWDSALLSPQPPPAQLP